MDRPSAIHRFFLLNPFKRGLFEWGLLGGCGILGRLFSWSTLPWQPWSNVLGAGFIIWALVFHFRVERAHAQAHQSAHLIQGIVTTGAYKRIRHPLYLSLMVLNLGLGLVFGILAGFYLSLFTLPLWGGTALAEEKYLLEKFPRAYSDYREKVKWRMIPGLF